MSIILYSTNCPKCRILEQKLNSKNITFTINNDVDEMEKLGIMSAPVLKIDGELYNFGEAIKWVKSYSN